MQAGTLPSVPGIPQLIQQSSSSIHFKWTEPFDNGGSQIVEYQILITKVSDNTTTMKTIINSNEFDFNIAQGMIAGNQYQFKIRAKNYYTHYYSLGDLAPWSAVVNFYSSDLPQSVPQLSFTNRTKTDATITWSHLASQSLTGYSTIAPYYLLWVDDCNGGSISNLLVNSTTALSYQITNMPPGSKCNF